jgi:hypothetical protein
VTAKDSWSRKLLLPLVCHVEACKVAATCRVAADGTPEWPKSINASGMSL